GGSRLRHKTRHRDRSEGRHEDPRDPDRHGRCQVTPAARSRHREPPRSQRAARPGLVRAAADIRLRHRASRGRDRLDTGETSRTAERGYLPAWHPYLRYSVRVWVSPEEEMGPQLTRLGTAPRDVRWVVMTDLHTGHAGGLRHSPPSEVLISRLEMKA